MATYRHIRLTFNVHSKEHHEKNTTAVSTENTQFRLTERKLENVF